MFNQLTTSLYDCKYIHVNRNLGKKPSRDLKVGKKPSEKYTLK